MERNAQRFFLTAFIAAAGALLSAGFGPAFAQAPEAGRGAPHDWSHRHLVHTNPDTRDEAARKGTLAFERWQEKHRDPRFAAQVARKTRFVQTAEHRPFSPEQLQWANRHRRDPPPAAPDINRDWSNVMGGATGVGRAGVFPAKYGPSFDTADCANDFVVYTTASSGQTGSGVRAFRTNTFVGVPTGNLVITNGTRTLTLTASGTLNTGTNFLNTGGTTAVATNLRDAINRNGGSVGVTATSSTASVTITAITHGAGGNSITTATGSTLTNFGTLGVLGSGSGTAGQPTIVAFNQLYKTTCGTTSTPVPATFWSYNTGVAAFTETSPVLSLDGTQVAFVQRTGTAASLVLLKWSSTVSVGTVGAPTALTTQATAAAYRACTAPCMFVIAFNGGPNNTNSSPFYDYTNDVLYVGADNGTLHKFTGVFGYNYDVYTGATPAEVVAGGWPVTVSTGNLLSSPVYDSDSGLVFVGSTSGTTTGGSLHSVNATSGALVTSARLATNSSSGVRDSPIVDSQAQRVYAFVGSDLGVATAGTCNTIPCAAVFQFATTFTGGAAGTKTRVGRGVTSTTLRFLYAGTFDDAYYTSGTPASPSGNLYVCGGLAATASRPTLWKIPIASNVVGTPVVGPSLVSANANCSPVTGVMNGANEYIFTSVTAGGNDTGCTGACIYMYNLTGLTWAPAAVANAGFAATGGASGVIVDNISSTTGASQIYYSTLTSPGNAIQASQAALQ